MPCSSCSPKSYSTNSSSPENDSSNSVLAGVILGLFGLGFLIMIAKERE